MINVLANIHIPSSSKICVTDFGRTEDFELNYDYVEPFDQFLKKSSQNKHFDALFLFYPEYNAIPPLIEEADIPLIAFVSDWNLGYYPLKASLSRFDLIICDKIGLDVLPKVAEGVPVLHWNMYGYMPEQYKNIQRSNNGDDVLFIGNIVPTIQKERAAYLKRVASMNDRIKSRIATNVRGSDYVNALASSKVIFNRSIRSEANMRVFESLAVDKIVLIEEDNNEIRDYFEPGRDCVVYNSENLEDVLIEYVSDDAKRTRIENAAKEKKDLYSFSSMLDKLYENQLFSSVINGKRNRKSADIDSKEKLFRNVLHGLFASGVQVSESVFYNDFNSLLNASGRQVDKGLLVRLQYAITKTQRRPLDNVLGVCRNVYESAKSISEGRVWNAFNYAVLMDALDNVDIAEKCYLETLECMNGADAAAFYGTPVFIIGEEWYQEFNLFEYRDNSLDVKKRLLTSVVLTRLAQIFVNKGRRSEAEKLFKRAIDFYPQNTEANYWYGLLSSSTQRLIGYRYLKIAYEQNSFDHRYWNSLISAANGAGRTSESEDFIREMRLLKPLAESVYGQSELMF